ncbi:MAG: DUF1549 domain-containing protein, partial [Planctomycetaceae bacterium]|nr:DUF1549 domain-containing protein [Planctomycetaceae bacterium]
MSCRSLICLAVLIGCLSHTVFAAGPDFVKEIRPIFESRCYECHGPEMKEAGLRLDRKEDALAGGDTGDVIMPGKPEESLLLKYVSGDDPDRVMPPDGDNLTAAQIELLRAWIKAGAEWPDGVDGAEEQNDHWAYQPLQRLEPPLAGVHPIDAFVRARLVEAKIAPAPQADRSTLIKRLYYDLLGLPPTPAAVAAFVNNQSPQAYEQLVDELLASPHFGERWGRHWLDKARYADSDGYEKDRPRYHAWRYRDWVIDATNADMPFDQFTIEQLAGDLLPEPTHDQLVATGFNRQTLTNTEGGTDQEEFRVEAIFDRVETVGSVWLGLTLTCARCHSHKYDDIPQREYYQLFAYFNNADEQNRTLPSSAAAQDAYLIAKAEFDAKLKELSAPLAAAREQIKPAYAEWEQMQRTAVAEILASPP